MKNDHLLLTLKKAFAIQLFFVLTFFSTAFSQNKARSINIPNGRIGYLEHLPKDYNQGNKRYPVMIFLHGISERGDGSRDLNRVKKNGPPKLVEQGDDMSFTVNGKQESLILVSPQLRADYNSWPAFYVDYVVEHVKKTYRIDTDRIYLTGLSLGGGGCWTYASYKAEYAKKLAAIVPICAAQSYKSNQVDNLVSGKVNVWALHGDADPTIPLQYSKDWVNNINRRSPGLASLTVYHGANHSGAWERGYRVDHQYHTPNIYEWLLQQKRGSSRASDPTPSPAPAPEPKPVASGNCGCDHTITPSNSYVDGQRLGVKPGDVVCVQAGQYKYLNLFNFKGSSSAPITIKNCGGQVRIGNSSTNYGIVMNNNQYIKFTGTGSGDKYGFKVDGGSRYLSSGFAASGKSSDFTVDHVEITKVEAGVLAKTSPTCDASTWKGNFTMRNVRFSDFYIHDIKGEGFYVGNTASTSTVSCNGQRKTVESHRIENLRIYNNRIENAGWDGIQVAQASINCEIFDNQVYNYGTANKSSQQAGILVGGNATGKVYRNLVKKGTGSGIQIFGTGTITVYNNIIIDAGEDAIFCDDRSPVPMTVRFVNNTIVNPKRYGIAMYSDVSNGNVAKNNVIVNSGKKYIVKLNGNVKLSESNNYQVTSLDNVKFTNPSGSEYKLTSSSPAVDAGTNTSSYGVTDGYYGTSRPAGGQYDIGASEYSGARSSGSNQPPTVDAGSSQALTLPVNYTTLTASASDPDGSIASYAWTKKSGPSASLENASTQKLSVKNMGEGTYVFTVTVKDNRGASASDDVQVTVRESGSNPPPSPAPAAGNGLNYKYYEGSWNTLPNFSRLNPRKSGTVANFSLSPRQRNDDFGFEFEGYINIKSSGTYTFYSASDDGSSVYIDDSRVVANDGLHAKEERSGDKYLSNGLHKIRVVFFEHYGHEILEVRYAGPGMSKRTIPDNVLFTSRNTNARTATSDKGLSIEADLLPEISFGVTAYPNPVENELKLAIEGAADETLSLQVIDVTGRVVLEKEVLVEQNIEEVQLGIGQYVTKTGLFYVMVKELTSGEQMTMKLLKQ